MTFVNIIAFLYFNWISFIFWFINIFKKKETIPPIRNEILRCSINQLHKLIRTRQITPSDIIEAYIKRIEEVNPFLNAIVYRNFNEAREQAEKAGSRIAKLSDEHLVQLYKDKPLFGLPFTVKDCLRIKGKPCTVGQLSRKLKNEPEKVTAVAVQRMLDAGSILLAVTAVPELCVWIEVNTVAWGKTNNAYDNRRTCGGSSGGEGALQGAGASLVGIGSDIAGSVRIPSYHNGIFGLITSPGLTPQTGHLPQPPDGSYQNVMGRIGPLTRFAEDLPLLAKILTDGKVAEEDNKIDLKKLRYFSYEEVECSLIEPFSNVVINAVCQVLENIFKNHGVPYHSIRLPEMEDILDMYSVSIFGEKDNTFSLLMRDAANPSQPPNIFKEFFKSLIGQSEYTISLIMLCAPWFEKRDPIKQQIFRKKRDQFKNRLSDLLGNNGILIMPSWPTLPQYHWETVFKQTTLHYTGMINMLGLPAVQCPIGLVDGIPLGVQVVANEGGDQLLIAVAQEIEKNFGGWVEPIVSLRTR